MEDVPIGISVLGAILVDISENPQLLRNPDYITSPMSATEWETALRSALCDVDRVASRK